MARRILAALVSTATAAAQTFVVAASGGPGVSFTTIAAAVATVPDGATLLVQPGSYAPFSITGKGLSILGQPGVTIASTPFAAAIVQITGTSPSQSVVLRDLAIVATFGAPQHLLCTNCQGPVLLQGIGMDATYGFERLLVVQQCGQVMVDGCGPFRGSQSDPAWTVVGSAAVFAASDATAPLQPALLATNSDVQLVGCALAGGGFGGPGLALTASRLRVSAACTLSGAGFINPGIAVAGTGTVALDPAVTLVGSIASTLSLVIAPQATVIGSGGGIGTTATATMHGAVGHVGALLLGLPGAPTVIPGIENAAWLLPSAFSMLAFGPLGTPLTASVPVPANPRLRGELFAWQAVAFAPATGLAFSAPAMFTP